LQSENVNYLFVNFVIKQNLVLTPKEFAALKKFQVKFANGEEG